MVWRSGAEIPRLRGKDTTIFDRSNRLHYLLFWFFFLFFPPLSFPLFSFFFLFFSLSFSLFSLFFSLFFPSPPTPLASFLAAAHARIIAAEGSAALSRGSRGPRERAKVLLSPPIYPLLLHALHHSSVSASSPLSPRETHHKSYTSRIKHTGTRAPGTPSFAMGGEKKFIFENRSFFRSL